MGLFHNSTCVQNYEFCIINPALVETHCSNIVTPFDTLYRPTSPISRLPPKLFPPLTNHTTHLPSSCSPLRRKKNGKRYAWAYLYFLKPPSQRWIYGFFFAEATGLGFVCFVVFVLLAIRVVFGLFFLFYPFIIPPQQDIEDRKCPTIPKNYRFTYQIPFYEK